MRGRVIISITMTALGDIRKSGMPIQKSANPSGDIERVIEQMTMRRMRRQRMEYRMSLLEDGIFIA